MMQLPRECRMGQQLPHDQVQQKSVGTFHSADMACTLQRTHQDQANPLVAGLDGNTCVILQLCMS